MMKYLFFIAILVSALAAQTLAQTTPKPTPTRTVTATTGTAPAPTGEAKLVRAAFDKIVEGIRKSDAEMVTNVYQNSPNTIYFNNNGTVTRGWEQDKTNRQARYPDVTNVKLEVRDVRVEVLGATGAYVSCLWTQTQDFKGTPESAAGRMTIVFRKVGGAWKAVHLHTSPDRPDTTRPVFPSERAPAATTPNE